MKGFKNGDNITNTESEITDDDVDDFRSSAKQS